ncbi:MAG TPA: aspartate aminotransferase family protein [Saprospiraceae bacterium]|nr:aspartate aminotransferase family protein [Saprospiraceae bacterium]HMQ85705.1 aspartate aminotransferase family protein [Saprospiraceae bacterium]
MQQTAPNSHTEQSAWQEKAEAVLIRYCGQFSPFLIDKAQGAYIYTTEGKAILDFTSGQMCSVFGHNHPKVVEAIQKASDHAMHLLSTMLSPSVIELAEQLVELLPAGLDKAIFVNTGSESNEVALRMAKLATGGFEVLGFTGSWHGMTAGAQSHTYSTTRRGYGPVMPGSTVLPAPYAYRCPIKHCKGQCDNTCLEVGIELADKQSVGAPAAIIAEPVLSAAGIIDLPTSYVQRLKAIAEERGMMLIFDEAQTAMGRLGHRFAFERDGVVPDFLTLSKTLGGGLPLAATITSKETEAICHEKGFIYITSHVSDPLPAEIGLAMIRIMEEEQLVRSAREQGQYLKEQLLALQQKHECIGDVRGRGLLLGVEIVADREKKTPAPELGYRISEKCLELGLSMNIVRVPGLGGVFRIAPPLTITREEIDLGVAILDEAIGEVWAR